MSIRSLLGLTNSNYLVFPVLSATTPGLLQSMVLLTFPGNSLVVGKGSSLGSDVNGPLDVILAVHSLDDNPI